MSTLPSPPSRPPSPSKTSDSSRSEDDATSEGSLPEYEAAQGRSIWDFIADTEQLEEPVDALPAYYPRAERVEPPVEIDEVCEIHGLRLPCSFLVERTCWCPRARPIRNVACFKVCGFKYDQTFGWIGNIRFTTQARWPGCGEVCGRPWNCGHPCAKRCHFGVCEDVACAACVKERKEAELASQAEKLELDDSGTGEGREAPGSGAAKATAPGPEPAATDFPFAYTDYLLKTYASNPRFALKTESIIRSLVRKSWGSHHFPPCSRSNRKYIHFLAAFHGLESESLDREPQRNVVIRVPEPGKSRVWNDAPESDEEMIVQAPRIGVPRIGLKEAYDVWRRSGKLPCFPEPAVTEGVKPVETGEPTEQVEEDPNEALSTEPTEPTEPEPPKEKKKRKKSAIVRVVEGPKPVASRNPWDLLNETDE